MSKKSKKPSSGTDPMRGIGYGIPPKHTQFKPGHSGNKKGRPKGSKNKSSSYDLTERFRKMLLKEAYGAVPVRDGDQKVNITMMEAIIKSMAIKAAKGNLGAQRSMITMVSETEAEMRADREKLMATLINYKAGWERIFEECDHLGLPRPKPEIHPDNIIVDLEAGDVRVIKPPHPTRARGDDWLMEVKVGNEEELVYFKNRLITHPDEKDEIEQAIKEINELLELIRSIIPG